LQVNDMSCSDYLLKQVIRQYFKRLSVLITQIPSEFRRLLLPPYMLYTGFKSYLHIDPYGKMGFEIRRERASRFSIKTRRTKNPIEQEIFGILGDENMFRIGGRQGQLRQMVLTCRKFGERYRSKFPQNATVMNFVKPGITGPIKIEEAADVKVIDVSIYWVVRNMPYVKYIPFSWLFGSADYIAEIDPLLHCESDFYSFLFGRLYEILTRGYTKPLDRTTQRKVLEFYVELIERVQNGFTEKLAVTEADEYVFQQLLTRYKFFLCPEALMIEAQPLIPGKVLRKPDYCIHATNQKHIYVEIEPPFYKPFRKSIPSPRLKAALKQVAQWKKNLARQSPTKETIQYMIIIGLLDDLTKEEKDALETFSNAKEDLLIVTWNWVVRNIEGLKRQVMVKLKETSAR